MSRLSDASNSIARMTKETYDPAIAFQELARLCTAYVLFCMDRGDRSDHAVVYQGFARQTAAIARKYTCGPQAGAITKANRMPISEDDRPALITREFQEAFERAYQGWRETLCDADTQGLPWADPSSERLLQEVRLQLGSSTRITTETAPDLA